MFEYDGEDYFATDVVNNLVSAEIQCVHFTTTVNALLYTIINKLHVYITSI